MRTQPKSRVRIIAVRSHTIKDIRDGTSEESILNCDFTISLQI